MIKQNDLRDRLKDTFTTAEIFSRYYEPVNTGRSYTQTNCPVCGKKSFTLWEKNCKCYSCETNGNMDIFSLYGLLNNTSDFLEALYNIARDFGVISEEDYNACMSNHTCKPLNINFNALEEKKKMLEKKKKECPEAPLQSREVLSNVYSVIKEISPISGKQRFSIRKERQLSNERINEQYFNMPFVNENFYNKLFTTIKDRFGYEPKDLIGVPGFYSYDGIKVEFVKRKGLGILMAGSDGIIHGLQIRAYDEIDNKGRMILHKKYDDEGKEIERAKYYWCSSKGLPNGCTPGAPVDVLIPLDIEKMFKTCFITEGKFKIEKLVEFFNSPAISVQGVGNWVGRISPEIKYISEHFKDIRHIYTAFDGDLAFNFKIFNQCKKMIEEELKGLNISPMIVVWDYHFGKGIDDVLIDGHKDKIKAVNFYVFAELFEKYKVKIMNLYPDSVESKILDENRNKVDSEVLYPIYKEMVLEPLRINYL